MKQALSFDDVLIVPKYSSIASRKDVNLITQFAGLHLQMPILSANMDTITGVKMASELNRLGIGAVLHRFMSIEENVAQFNAINSSNTVVSVGIGENEQNRACQLYKAGARVFLIDVAHGASLGVVRTYDYLRSHLDQNCTIIVGNFATKSSIAQFERRCISKRKPDAYKVGIGGGSMCTTRMMTGCGLPTLASIMDCAELKTPIIADGGIRTSGDIAKALAAGATAVMVGRLLAGTDEAEGALVRSGGFPSEQRKEYRGSASLASYKVQGKVASHRAPEGESTTVPLQGPVEGVLQRLEGGLRSALTYVGAHDTLSFKDKAELVVITHSGHVEGTPHGK